MTNITFYKKSSLLLGFEVKGHTGKAEKGSDLLCAQISTVAQLAVVGVKEVLKTDAFVEISDGYAKVMLSQKSADSTAVQTLLKTCKVSFESILIDEEKYAKLEVKNV